MHATVLLVPLDDRPVCLDFVVELAKAAGLDVRTPDRTILGGRDRPADVDAVWGWLEGAVSSDGIATLIASAEMLCFGGLAASRTSTFSFTDVAPRLERLRNLAGRVPIYLSALIPGTPVQATAENAGHWHTRDAAARQAHRERHLRINETLITMAGTLRYLLIGQDDTAPGSAGEAERRQLQTVADDAGAGNVLLTSGADELNARLLARVLADRTALPPAVRVIYTYPEAASATPLYEATPLRQTVEEHIESVGAHRAVEAVDVLLWVHNFEGMQQREARDQHAGGAIRPDEVRRTSDVLREMREAVAAEQVVALADVRFANGADDVLVRALLEEPRFAGIVAYAGWNTCSNTLGSALAQAVVAWHLRLFSMPGSDRIYRPVFLGRILDDWGYQAVVRPRLGARMAARGRNSAELGDLEGEWATGALEGLRADALPPLQASFRYHPVALRGVTFPWHRLFELRLDLEVAHFGGRTRQGGIVVVDYDPRWPATYEEDRRAILEALGVMVRGVEHVGSTAVPGLAAKPIIDIMLGVAPEDLDRIIEPLRRIGYEYNPDWEISMPHRRLFGRPRAEGATARHLHAVVHGSEFWVRHLRFRDYLRAHSEVAAEYGLLKKSLAAAHPGSIDYTFSKTEFIRAVEAKAGVPHRPRSGRPARDRPP